VIGASARTNSPVFTLVVDGPGSITSTTVPTPSLSPDIIKALRDP
jgi:hypothetical protein